VPDIAQELHGGRHQRVVFGELELRWKDAAFVWRVLRALYESLPNEQIIFGDWTGGDTVRWVGGEVLVLLEEPLRCYRVHDGCVLLFLETCVGGKEGANDAVKAWRSCLSPNLGPRSVYV